MEHIDFEDNMEDDMEDKLVSAIFNMFCGSKSMMPNYKCKKCPVYICSNNKLVFNMPEGTETAAM